MKELGKISRRRVTYHDVIEKRGEYFKTNGISAGRFYAGELGINDTNLIKILYEQECIDYILENYQIRDLDEILDYHKTQGIIWKSDDNKTFKCENIVIECDHMNHKLTEYISIGADTSFIEEYYSESIEDIFQAAYQCIVYKNKGE